MTSNIINTPENIISTLSNESEQINLNHSQNSDIAIYECDPNGMIIFANDAFYELMNINKNINISNYHAFEFIDISSFIEIPELEEKQLLNKNINIDLKALTINLKSFWVNANIEPKINSKNEVISTTISFKKLDRQVQTSFDKTNLNSNIPSVQNDNNFVIILDNNHIIKFISDNYKQIININYEVDRRVNLLKYVHPEDRNIVEKEYNSLLNDPTKLSIFRFRYLIDDKNYIWLESISTNHLDNPTINGILLNIRNISKKLGVEEFNAKYSDNIRLLVKNTNHLLILINLEGKIIFSEGKIFNFFGNVEPKNFHNMNIFNIPELDESIKNDILSAINEKEIRAVVTTHGYSFDVTFSPYYNSENQLSGVIIIASDISQIIKIVEEKEKLIELLQISRQAVISESEKLLETNEKLLNSEEDLRKNNSEKDKFFSIISHDLRSPLSGILGLINSIVEDFDNYSPIEIKESLKNLKGVSENLYKLLDDLLTWSRIQRGVMVINPDYISLKIITSNVFEILNTNAVQKNIELSVEHKDPNLTVFTDFNMSNTSLRNLVSNAIKFTPNGGKIHIITEQLDENFAKISVKDTGIGMEQSVVDNLFNVGESRTTPGTNNEAGSGLGLILCKEMIEQIGGDITVTSELGKGTTFAFTIPLIELNSNLLKIKENRILNSEEKVEEIKAKKLESTYKEKCITDKEYNPSKALLEALPDIIPDIESKFLPIRNNLLETFYISDIITFASSLKKYGEEFKLPCMEDYALALFDKCVKMDISQINEILIQFDFVINRLKGFIGMA